MTTNNNISATDCKKYFLRLVDEVKNERHSFTITKRKTPIAKIIPLDLPHDKVKKNLFGCMKGTLKIKEDIVNFSSEDDWEANNE